MIKKEDYDMGKRRTLDKSEILVTSYVKNCKKRFMDYMGLDVFPDFNLKVIVPSIDKTNAEGYGAFAEQRYDIESGTHMLLVWRDLYKPILNGDYIIFHELTHIYDTEKYVRRDKEKNVAIKGYTEFHAAQVELEILLNFTKHKQEKIFSMKDKLETVSGSMNVLEYCLQSLSTVANMFSRSDFPNSLETLLTTLGMLFNYYGRKTICMMYAQDYSTYRQEFIVPKIVKEFFPNNVITEFDDFFDGYLSEKKIETFMQAYFQMSIGLAKQLHLT